MPSFWILWFCQTNLLSLIFLPLKYLKNCSRNILNWIFRQLKILLLTKIVRLNSGHYATKYYWYVTQDYENLDIYSTFLFQLYNIFWSLFDLVWITSFCYIWTQNLPKYNLWTWTWSTPCISTFTGSWSVWPRGTVYTLGQ